VGIVLVSNDGLINPINFYSVSNISSLEDILKTKPIQVVANPNPNEKT